MPETKHLLGDDPIASFRRHRLDCRGGEAFTVARAMTPEEVIELIEESGLRGRGGAGFPTGTKWRTVRDYSSNVLTTTVVVNAAEGEPGTFKDRTILEHNPYLVLEGALIAAYAVDANEVIIATKAEFRDIVAKLRGAIAEITEEGWADGIDIVVVEGPDEYLYGEETALLEVIDGRPPFPRIAPPFRRGVTEIVEVDADVRSGSGLSAHVEEAAPAGETEVPPTLVNNVETLANVPRILCEGIAAFRSEGTERSPGSILCTITGHVRTPRVAEIELGTTLREAIEIVGGGAEPDRQLIAAVPGVSGSIIPADRFDIPLTYEDMSAAGYGLGSAGFHVLDDTVDPVSMVAGMSRFLAVESCGQCTPCKVDGLRLADLLEGIAASNATEHDLVELRRRASTVSDGARCSLGRQHEAVVQGLLDNFGPFVDAHVQGELRGVEPTLVAELRDVGDGTVVVNERQADKLPDWTYGEIWGGETPVERFTDHRSGTGLRDLSD